MAPKQKLKKTTRKRRERKLVERGAAHIRSSFNMYHGEPETVTVKFDLSLANVVFDEFNRNIIISEVGEKRFTASLRSAVTPTLISWLLQFYDRMEVVKPDSLKEKLLEIADALTGTYNAKEE